MPKIEVDEEDFLKSQRLRETVRKMMDKPSAAKLLKLAEKEIDPTVVHPDLEFEQVVDKRVGELTKTVTDFIAESKSAREKDAEERKLEKLQASMESGIARLKSDEGLTDEGEKALRELMTKKGIPDVDDAWAVFQRHNPPPPPAAPSSGRMFDVISSARTGDDEFIKGLIESRGENQQLVDKMAFDAINEVRGAQKRR
jgi:hypothetical protein